MLCVMIVILAGICEVFFFVASVTVKLMCSGINYNFLILNNVLEWIKRYGEYIRWCLRIHILKIIMYVDEKDVTNNIN